MISVFRQKSAPLQVIILAIFSAGLSSLQQNFSHQKLKMNLQADAVVAEVAQVQARPKQQNKANKNKVSPLTSGETFLFVMQQIVDIFSFQLYSSSRS